LSKKVDTLAEQVVQLAQKVAALAGGRFVWNACQAEMSAAEEYKDEGPLNAGATAFTGFEGRVRFNWTVNGS
jgi:hypothetical protein